MSPTSFHAITSSGLYQLPDEVILYEGMGSYFMVYAYLAENPILWTGRSRRYVRSCKQWHQENIEIAQK
jgi:hypothetical protein